MNDIPLKLDGIKSIQLSLELPKDTPRVNITSFFILLARKNGISCNSSITTIIKDDPSVLNIVIINNLDQYEKYMGYSAVNAGLKDNLLLLMFGTENNYFDIFNLSRIDFTISEPLSTKYIINQINNIYLNKKIKNRNIEDQIIAEHLLKEKRYEDAYTVLEKIKARGLPDAITICLYSEVYEGMGKNDIAFEILNKSINEKYPNYNILTQMYGLLSRAQMWDHASIFLTKLLNNYQLDREGIRMATGNAIKSHKYNDVQKIIDYILHQDQKYINYLDNFVDVTFYILIKFLMVNKKVELTEFYLKKMMILFPRSSSFVKIVELAIDLNSNTVEVIDNILKNSPGHQIYHDLLTILTQSDTIKEEYLVDKCKKLIDQEKVRVKELFNIYFDALEYIGKEDEIKKYENLYNYHYGNK